MAAKLGILAGGGDLPRHLVNACRASGRDFFVIAIEGQTDPDAVVGAPHEWVRLGAAGKALRLDPFVRRSEEHTSELQSLMRISYAVFCLQTKKILQYNNQNS